MPVGGTPRPCSPEEFERTKERNRLTEEAIALYRRWTKESTRLYRAGGTDKPTKEMLATMTGKSLQSALAIFHELKSARAKAVSGEVEIITIGPDPSQHAGPGDIALRACLDSRSLHFKRKGKTIGKGTVFVEYVSIKPVDGMLRIWTASSGEVESC